MLIINVRDSHVTRHMVELQDAAEKLIVMAAVHVKVDWIRGNISCQVNSPRP